MRLSLGRYLLLLLGLLVLRLADKVWRLEHARERGDDFASLLDGLDCICCPVELRLDGVLYAVEHLREAEQVVFRFVE